MKASSRRDFMRHPIHASASAAMPRNSPSASAVPSNPGRNLE
jgi:hypothetical protein